jgi:hypothetical protein
MALGALPDQPRARRTWQEAATRIAAYRFDHTVTDARYALGSPRNDKRERAHWQRAQRDLQRAQRDLSHRIDRWHSHEVQDAYSAAAPPLLGFVVATVRPASPRRNARR